MIQVEHFKRVHINRFLASKDASKRKAHEDTRSNGRRANKTARVKWGRGKREANDKQCKCEGDEFVMDTWYILTW